MKKLPDYPIYCVDAFASKPFSGNPAGVVITDETAPEDWMGSVAGEMNLSETAFAVKRGRGEYGLRWFTPTAEVDLCGHATLATAFALWEEEGEPEEAIVFQTKSGPLTARRMEGGIDLDFPAIEVAPSRAPSGMWEALGLSPGSPVYFGGDYYLVELASESAVKAVSPNFALLRKIDAFGFIVTAVSREPGVDFVSRFFAPAKGVDEDPVTGSAHCRLAPYWAQRLGKRSFFARQVSRRGGEIWASLTGNGRVILRGKAAMAWRGKIAMP